MFIQTGGPLVACMLLCPKKMFVDNLGAPWSSGAWGPGPNGPVVNPPLFKGCKRTGGGKNINLVGMKEGIGWQF